MKTQTIVYKKGGNCQCNGGTYAWLGVDDDSIDAALADGWKKTLPEALGVVAETVEPSHNDDSSTDDNAPPTRKEIETKARELGIRVLKKDSDEELMKKIEAALAEESPEA